MDKEEQIINPNKRKITKLDADNEVIESFSAEILREDKEENSESTLITLEKLTKGNWRVDDSLSFVKSELDEAPEAEDDFTTRIMSTKTGDIWLIPPQGKSKIKLNQAALSDEQLKNIDNVPNKANSADLNTHVANKLNPHGVTTTQIGAEPAILIKNTAFNSPFRTTVPIASNDTVGSAGTITSGSEVAAGDHKHPSDVTKADTSLNNVILTNGGAVVSAIDPSSLSGLTSITDFTSGILRADTRVYSRTGTGFTCFGTRLSNGLIFNWGYFQSSTSSGQPTITLAIPYRDGASNTTDGSATSTYAGATYSILQGTLKRTLTSNLGGTVFQVINKTATAFTVRVTYSNGYVSEGSTFACIGI